MKHVREMRRFFEARIPGLKVESWEQSAGDHFKLFILTPGGNRTVYILAGTYKDVGKRRANALASMRKLLREVDG